MAITALSGQRWQGSSTDTVVSTSDTTTVSSLTDVVFDDATKIGTLTYSGNEITLSASTSHVDSINANLQFQNQGTQIVECDAENTGTSAWITFGLASAKVTDSGSDHGAQLEYGIRKADDGRTFIMTSSGTFGSSLGTFHDNSKLRITNNRTSVTYEISENGGSWTQLGSSTTHGTPAAAYYLQATVSQTGTAGSYTFDYTGDVKITTTTVTDEKTTITDVPAGSEFQETNTRKFFQYAGFSDGLGSSVDGTTTNATEETSTKKFGTGSVDFNGTNAFGTIDGLSSTEAKNAIKSISGWFNVTMSANKRLFSFADTGGESYLRIGMYTSGSYPNVMDIVFQINDTTQWQIFSPNGTFTGSTWHHFVITHDDTEPHFYIDGVDVTTSSTWHDTTDKTKWLDDATNINNFRFAVISKDDEGNTGFGEFYLDDFACWNTVLPLGTDEDTVDSVRWLYNTGTGRLASTIPTGLLAYYNMDSTTLTNKASGWVERGTAI